MSAYSEYLAKEWFDWEKNIEPILSLYAKVEREQTPVVTTSWDDGHILDIKLAALLKKYNIRGTFYISPRDREFTATDLLTDEDIRAVAHDFEIGAHTMTHPRLPQISEGIARKEIIESKTYLEAVISRPVTSFCYPRGEYTAVHRDIVREAGFHLARTAQRFSLDRGIDSYALPTSIHTYDHFSDVWGVLCLTYFNPFQFCMLYRNWEKQAIELFEHALRRGGVFHLWGHSWEIEGHGDWERLERVLSHIAQHPRVRYLTNAELLES